MLKNALRAVKRIPRDDVPAFLAEREAKTSYSTRPDQPAVTEASVRRALFGTEDPFGIRRFQAQREAEALHQLAALSGR
ncbi:MAG: hypothetical protein ACK4S4_15710 [Pyrinomonadaceae bacterium]